MFVEESKGTRAKRKGAKGKEQREREQGEGSMVVAGLKGRLRIDVSRDLSKGF